MSEEQTQREDNDIRSLRTMPLGTLVMLSKAAPTQSRRFVREILCRLGNERMTLGKAEIPYHAGDSMAAIKNLHVALGEITENYHNSLDVKTRLRFASGGMTEREARSLLNVLVSGLDEGEEKEYE